MSEWLLTITIDDEPEYFPVKSESEGKAKIRNYIKRMREMGFIVKGTFKNGFIVNPGNVKLHLSKVN